VQRRTGSRLPFVEQIRSEITSEIVGDRGCLLRADQSSDRDMS